MNSDASIAASEQPVSASTRWPLVILILFLPVWTIGLFYRGIWMPDEPREYDIAVNMVGDHDFVVGCSIKLGPVRVNNTPMEGIYFHSTIVSATREALEAVGQL